MARPPASPGPDSRSRLVAAATAEFADHGLAGASIDRIARKARLNKAMIYYHFESKDALYQEIIRTTIASVARRVGAIRDAALPPEEKLASFVRAFAEEATRRPEFPRVMLRETLEQGRHLDEETLRLWMSVPEAMLAILAEGQRTSAFRRVNPTLAYFATVGPIVLLSISRHVLARVERVTGRRLPVVDDSQAVEQLQSLVAGLLAPASPPAGIGVPHASSRASTSRSTGTVRRARPQRVRRTAAG
ncbi:MAG: TetR/AcrR family transcriptional regulator [Vicinamibacterales bacterium]